MSHKTTQFISALALAVLPLATLAPAQAQTTLVTTPFVSEQPKGEWLARVFLGAAVQNTQGETVGDIRDLGFDRTGRIRTVVLGVGGFLGLGEKFVAIPFEVLTYAVGKDESRIIVVALSKDDLKAAPAFKAVEKTTLDKWEDKAVVFGQKTVEKATELKDQAVKKIDEMKSTAPTKQ